MFGFLNSILNKYYTNTTMGDEIKLDKEEHKYIRGDYEITVITYFYPSGQVAGTVTSSIKVENPKEKELKELQAKLDQAVESEDYSLAAQLKKEREELLKK